MNFIHNHCRRSLVSFLEDNIAIIAQLPQGYEGVKFFFSDNKLSLFSSSVKVMVRLNRFGSTDFSGGIHFDLQNKCHGIFFHRPSG